MRQPLVSRPPYGDIEPRATAQLPSGGPLGKGVIYIVINRANGKEYVGYTILPLTRRWIQHRSAARKGSGFALHAAIRKYGEDSFDNLTLGGEGVDYQVPGVRENHRQAVDRLSKDPSWHEALCRGIRARQANPEYRARQALGCRAAGLLRRSPNCTRCGVVLTAENTSRRSWCQTCCRAYHRAYRLKRKQA